MKKIDTCLPAYLLFIITKKKPVPNLPWLLLSSKYFFCKINKCYIIQSKTMILEKYNTKLDLYKQKGAELSSNLHNYKAYKLEI